jgi:hypothetical protein
VLTIARAERVMRWPVAEWAGQCYAVASQLVTQGLVQGIAVYGHWRGKVHPKSMFARKRDLPIHHGWVSLPDGGVLDPTRWVFEHKEPYLFWSPVVPPEYDEGGNRFRLETLQPPPVFDSKDRVGQLLRQKDLPPWTWRWIEGVLESGPRIELSRAQCFWLANLPLEMLGPHAKPLYEALERRQRQGLVPIDNFRCVKEGRWS